MKIKSFLFLTFVLGMFSSYAMEKDNTLSNNEENLFEIVRRNKIDQGDIEKVKQLINDNVNAVDERGRTALMWAAFWGYEKIVDILLDAGADVNAKDKHGDTALMYAILFEHNEVVEKLLGAGAKVNAKNKDGLTALIKAAKKDNKEIVQKLLDCGADILAKGRDGRTASMAANLRGQKEIAEMLHLVRIEASIKFLGAINNRDGLYTFVLPYGYTNSIIFLHEAEEKMKKLGIGKSDVIEVLFYGGSQRWEVGARILDSKFNERLKQVINVLSDGFKNYVLDILDEDQVARFKTK